MQISEGKTAVFFHAKDDLPEVRREVFRVLLQQDVRFHAVVRNKPSAIEVVNNWQKINPDYRYSENHLYDGLARSLLFDKLHTGESYNVVFAKRGASDRSAALKTALENARTKYCTTHGISACPPPVVVSAASSMVNSGLQAADYFLWALQMFYERGEDRFISMLWPKVECVRDLDDQRDGDGGVHYTQKRPLNAASYSRNAEDMGSSE